MLGSNDLISQVLSVVPYEIIAYNGSIVTVKMFYMYLFPIIIIFSILDKLKY